jgi:hypothetical protein
MFFGGPFALCLTPKPGSWMHHVFDVYFTYCLMFTWCPSDLFQGLQFPHSNYGNPLSQVCSDPKASHRRDSCYCQEGLMSVTL